MHYYSHHIADFNNATRHLTRTERSIYIELLWLYYDKEDPLPDDPSLLARLILAPGEEDSIKQVLEEFFTDLGQGYINARCDVEISKYHAKADRAIRANKKRWGSNNDLKSDADQIPTNNHKPITNNEKDTTLSSPAGPTKAPGKIPIQAIVDAWNIQAAAHGMVQCLKVTTTLRGQIRQRWADLNTIKKWHNFFDHIGMNNFLSGRAKPGPGRSKPFRASLLWVTKETNFAKIAQEEYD